MAGISPEMLPVADQPSDAATTTELRRGPAAPGAAAASVVVEAVAVVEAAEAAEADAEADK